MSRIACIALLVSLLSVSAMAAPVAFSLTARDFDSLGVTGAASTLLSTNWNSNGWQGTIASQAFALDDGKYLYLYQARNAGPDVLEVLVIRGFADAETASAGYLNANLPSGFIGGVTPAGQSYDSGLGIISFQYPSFMLAQVNPGNATQTFFMIAPGAPTQGQAFVIDGGNPAGPVYVPVPEPTVMALVLSGLGMAIVRRARR